MASCHESSANKVQRGVFHYHLSLHLLYYLSLCLQYLTSLVFLDTISSTLLSVVSPTPSGVFNTLTFVFFHPGRVGWKLALGFSSNPWIRMCCKYECIGPVLQHGPLVCQGHLHFATSTHQSRSCSLLWSAAVPLEWSWMCQLLKLWITDYLSCLDQIVCRLLYGTSGTVAGLLHMACLQPCPASCDTKRLESGP